MVKAGLENPAYAGEVYGRRPHEAAGYAVYIIA